MNHSWASASWKAIFSREYRSDGVTDSMALRRAAVSVVKGWIVWAVSSKAITMPRLPRRMEFTRSRACRLASSSRDLPTSVAAIEAERSIRITETAPAPGACCTTGRESASTIRISSSNCKNSSRFRRSR